MKRNKLNFIWVVLAAFVLGQNLNAQSAKEELELYQSVFGMEKKVIVAEFLKLKSDDAFWTIYDEYETERKALGKKRVDVLNEYAENYDALNNEKYDEIIANMISLRKSTDKLVDTYYKKIKKASGSKVAAQFFQLEAYFVSAIRLTIMEGIPYIGEFDK